MATKLDSFLNKIQKTCLPGVWSKGVSLSRENAVIADVQKEDELVFRVKVSDKPVSPKVSLWPEDEDWYCDCEDRNEVCAHVAAVAIALRTGKSATASASSLSISSRSTSENTSHTGTLNYSFSRKEGKLALDRWITYSGKPKQRLTTSLVAHTGGIASGRIPGPPISVTREDFAIDGKLEYSPEYSEGDRSAPFWVDLFKILSQCSHLDLEGETITISAKPLSFKAVLKNEGSGFRLQKVEDPTLTEIFKNGAALCGKVLKAVEVPSLSAEERNCLLPGGALFTGPEGIRRLVTEILPKLEKKIQIEIQATRLPRIRQVEPQIVLNTDWIKNRGESGHILTVIPSITYGGENTPSGSSSSILGEILVSDPLAEKQLLRKLQNDLQLSLGQRVEFDGESALEFLEKAKQWNAVGKGIESFSVRAPLKLEIDLTPDRFEVSFYSESREKSRQAADPAQVLRAWRENRNYVPLLNGGWAKLPKDALSRYADRIEELLALRNTQKALPAYFVPEVAQICRDLGQFPSDSLRNLGDLLLKTEQIPEATLPSDLTAPLRSYQKVGVNWLSFLQSASMGAMLADDMGLGKTLQALCIIDEMSAGKTLIIAPTSVLFGWANQIRQFRPDLSFSLYYGNQRNGIPNSQVILTTYGLLRMDKELLTSMEWDTVILDEAQVIKNPDSQITRAVHTLRAKFRLALSGTPLENRLEDLWSQFQFINPGLLGTLESFQERFSGPMARGDEAAAQKLRTRVKPFILRRLKKDVATDLPARTEKILYCELNSEETETYQALLTSARKEVLEKLELGGNVMAALELLLRLRQACCHPALVGGLSRSSETSPRTSSKVELLLQTLGASIARGHRALVFSQWTSYLDLIEPELTKTGISFLRLDGSTSNRSEIVDRFQAATGPSVMLISLKAGGVGLTLTAADHIFLMDPWWNPAVEDQAADRAHRIGQVNPVLIHKLVARETIEENILELQKSKLALAASVLEGASAAGGLTRDDILALFNNPPR